MGMWSKLATRRSQARGDDGPAMKLVVVPGLPRSGTTYVFHQLLTRNPELFNSALQKESHVFEKPSGPDDVKVFFGEHDPSKWYMDASPGYLIGQADAIPNILAFPAAEKKVVLCLRNPVDQLFAHYLHDIKAHWALRQFGDDVARPLFATSTLKRYLSMRAAAITALVEGVGRENVLVVNFHRDLPDPEGLTAKFSSFFGHDLSPLPSEVIGPGGQLPQYVYGGSRGLEIAVGERLLFVPPRAMLLQNNRESAFWPELPEDVAATLLRGSSTWTREVTPEQFALLADAFAEDWGRSLTVLGLAEEDFAVEPHLVAKPAGVSREVAAQLEVRGDIAEYLRTTRFVSGFAPPPS